MSCNIIPQLCLHRPLCPTIFFAALVQRIAKIKAATKSSVTAMDITPDIRLKQR